MSRGEASHPSLDPPRREWTDQGSHQGGADQGSLRRGRVVGIVVLVTLACLGALSFIPFQELFQPSDAHMHFAVHGRGNTTTRLFEAPKGWQIAWSYDCHDVAPSGVGRFVVSMLDGSKVFFPRSVVDDMGANNSSVVHIESGGSRYLEVTSACSWSMDVSG